MSEKPSDKLKVSDKKMDRLSFLRKSALTLVGGGTVSAFPFLSLASKSLKYPFTLGVASGDPLPDSVVIWTRLAREPLIGAGSMPKDPIEVDWEVSEDRSFRHIVKQGAAIAKPHYAHSVHVEVKGLASNQWYYYHFKANNETSPIGRTKTLPTFDAKIPELNIAFASCQKYKEAFYTAYDHIINENLDLVFFLGDYIYQGDGQGHIGRGHIPQKEIKTLQDYRIRYGQYKSDPSLQAAHAAFPWIVTLDDHEIENDWAGDKGNPEDKKDEFLARRAAAFQAYYEHMPVRDTSIPHNINMQLYRRFKYGNLAEFNVLDTHQYRTDYACGTHDPVNPKECEDLYDSSRTMLGDAQEQWLFNNLKASEACWNMLPQQVLMTQLDYKSGAGKILDTEKWDGYIATRNRLFNVVKQNKISNLVVLTGDYHRNMANDLLEDFNDPNSPVLGTEFVCTSVGSNGDGEDMTANGKKVLNENIKTDFRVVPYVSRPGAPIHTRASFKVKNGDPGVSPV